MKLIPLKTYRHGLNPGAEGEPENSYRREIRDHLVAPAQGGDYGLMAKRVKAINALDALPEDATEWEVEDDIAATIAAALKAPVGRPNTPGFFAFCEDIIAACEGRKPAA